jgi:hypothetical protein
MTRLPIAALVWRLRRAARAIGWQAPAIGLAVLATVATYGWLVLPLEDSVAGVRQDAEALRSKMATRLTAREAADPAGQLQEFYRHFPAPETVPDTLQAIFDAASAANLGVEHAEYHMAAEPVGELSRYDVIIPLKGRYSQMREFLARILTEHQNLVLDGISFNRQTAAEIGVEAQLHLTLYLRGRE